MTVPRSTSPGTAGPTAEEPSTDDSAVRAFSVLDYGAVGDGVTDDTAALQAAFDAAGPGDTVWLPAGRTFVQADVLTVRRPGVTVTGGGTLLASREQRSSLVLAADQVTLSNVTLRIAATSRRWDAYEQQRLRLDGHTGIVVQGVTIIGSAAAGVYVGGGASGFSLEQLQVSGTRADGIHITQGAHDGRVVAPVVRNVGDDGVAVVSYRQDGAPCARIEIDTPLVDGSTGGRGVSVVGGTDITYRDIDVRNTYAAGVYIAAEGSWGTTGVSGAQVLGGSVTGANTGTQIDHGAVLVYNGTTDQPVQGVTISGLTITGTRATASRVVGLVVDNPGGRGIRDVVLSALAITGSNPRTSFVSNVPSTTYRATGWTRDGAGITV